MKCVIVAGGTEPKEELFKNQINDAELLIAADRGAEVFYKYNINPNLMMGDFDSIDLDVLNTFEKIDTIRFMPEKDYTDSCLALNKAIELGASEIALLGFTGTRLDHCFGNIGLLKLALENKIDCKIIDNNNEIFAINKSTTIFGECGTYFSLLAFSDDVRNLCIKRAKYELFNYDLKMGDGRTISNEFLDEPVELTFDSGTMLVFYSKD